jgi:purine-binding chemotaxis protein CheW
VTQLCTFRVGPELVGVDVAAVQEVIRSLPVTPVPLAPQHLAGLINLRGDLLVAIDLRIRLGGASRPDRRNPFGVVLCPGFRGDERICLLVDELGEVADVAGLPFQAPPATLDERAAALLRGVYLMPDRLLLALDPRLVSA